MALEGGMYDVWHHHICDRLSAVDLLALAHVSHPFQEVIRCYLAKNVGWTRYAPLDLFIIDINANRVIGRINNDVKIMDQITRIGRPLTHHDDTKRCFSYSLFRNLTLPLAKWIGPKIMRRLWARDHEPCALGFLKRCREFGKTMQDETPLRNLFSWLRAQNLFLDLVQKDYKGKFWLQSVYSLTENMVKSAGEIMQVELEWWILTGRVDIVQMQWNRSNLAKRFLSYRHSKSDTSLALIIRLVAMAIASGSVDVFKEVETMISTARPDFRIWNVVDNFIRVALATNDHMCRFLKARFPDAALDFESLFIERDIPNKSLIRLCQWNMGKGLRPGCTPADLDAMFMKQVFRALYNRPNDVPYATWHNMCLERFQMLQTLGYLNSRSIEKGLEYFQTCIFTLPCFERCREMVEDKKFNTFSEAFDAIQDTCGCGVHIFIKCLRAMGFTEVQMNAGMFIDPADLWNFVLPPFPGPRGVGTRVTMNFLGTPLEIFESPQFRFERDDPNPD